MTSIEIRKNAIAKVCDYIDKQPWRDEFVNIAIATHKVKRNHTLDAILRKLISKDNPLYDAWNVIERVTSESVNLDIDRWAKIDKEYKTWAKGAFYTKIYE